MTVICLVSPLPQLGRDTLDPCGYEYIQTRPPIIEQPMMDLALDLYTLEIARRYTHPPSSSIITMSKGISPSSSIRVVLGCHTSVVYHLGKQGWIDQIIECPEKRREILCKGEGQPWKVVTGYVLTDLYTEKTCSHIETTLIQVGGMTPAEIEEYIHKEEAQYAIGGLYLNGKGAQFIRCIEGSYFNALGCCPHIVKNLFRQVGINDPICHPR